MPLGIEFESDEFPATGKVANGSSVLPVDWSELLWAALTVGRPNTSFVFQHGESSFYEALFRLSLIRSVVEQSGPRSSRYHRTSASSALDPTEKGATNYFLGMTVAKLFADKLLEAPWALHFDIFRRRLGAQLGGRSRPDLLAQTNAGDWIALECKGRASQPNETSKKSAKDQAARVIAVQGKQPLYAIGAITFFKNETLHFFWRDPSPGDTTAAKLKIDVLPDDWQYYYRLIFEIVNQRGSEALQTDSPIVAQLDEADLAVGLHPLVLKRLRASDWQGAVDAGRQVGRVGEYRGDGIVLRAGPAWTRRRNPPIAGTPMPDVST
jgi:hypothetical protein